MFDSEIAPSADAEETQNPLGQSTDSQNADGAAAVFGSVKKLQLVPESRDAEDGHEVEQTVDFFDILAEALVVGKQLDPDRIQEGMKECFDDIPDHEATMDAGEFCKVVEEHLDLDLEDSDRAQLVAQVQGVKSAESTQEQDPVSVADFERWWDSFFETEMVDPFRAAVAEMEKSGVISPNSNFRGNWDLVQAVLLFYIAAMLPYRIGFSHDVVLWSAWFWLDLSIDIYFIFDLCLNFKTAVITSDGELLYKPKDIAKSYAKGWLPVDFVSCLPFGYIPYVLGEGEGGAGNKATRMLRMFRLLKLLRLVRIKRILDRWEEEMYGARALKIGKIVFLMAGAAHWVACTWFFVGAPTLTADGNSTVPYIMPNGDPTEGWVLRRYNSVEIADSISMWEKYRDSLFWSTMSVIMIDAAEVGMTPETYAEKLIYVISFIIGAFLVSMIIGQISDMIAHANPGDAAKADTIGLVHAFLHERRVGASLTKRVRAHFNQLYSNRGTTEDMQGFFDHLPRALALELAGAVGFIDDIQANRRSVVYKVPFCRNLSADDMIRLCCKMKHCAYEPPQVYLDGSLDRTRFIMREGERGTEMWVMLEGKVRVETTSGGGETVDLGTLGVSEFFGESAVLAEESPGVPLKRLRSVYAITQLVQTIALTYRDLCELRQESRTIDEAVEREAMGFKQIRPSMFKEKVSPLEKRVDALSEEMRANFASLQEQLGAIQKAMSA